MIKTFVFVCKIKNLFFTFYIRSNNGKTVSPQTCIPIPSMTSFNFTVYDLFFDHTILSKNSFFLFENPSNTLISSTDRGNIHSACFYLIFHSYSAQYHLEMCKLPPRRFRHTRIGEIRRSAGASGSIEINSINKVFSFS